LATGLQPVFDGATLLACTVALYFVLKLYLGFKGSKYHEAYVYYAGAASVLWITFVAKLILDFMGVQPEDFGVPPRDAAIIGALLLFALGLRKTREFWTPPQDATAASKT
jgi:hypothetical protein